MAWHRISDGNADAKTGVCSICGPTAVKVRNRRGYPEYTCMTPVREARRRYNREHRVPWTTAKRYADGRTTEERAKAIANQNGLCAICKQRKPLVGDHCHRTGKARDMLCYCCNIMLGMARDDREVLAEGIRYLDRHL